MILHFDDTIIALATPPGQGAIGTIRLSGPRAITIVNNHFPKKNLLEQPSHTVHVGLVKEGEDIIDEVVVSLFKAPHSYTKEDVVEVSCHGSVFIIEQLIGLYLKAGARLAKPGEFTQRAYLNGRFDLSQAEAVADLIASESKAAHDMAMQQMRGGFSKEILALRQQLIDFASLLELELDFSEEDVEFASRDELKTNIKKVLNSINPLIESFALGNALKKGVPVVIAGKPNVGKSTLLNALLNEEKAIVSDIPGTTRDYIEDQMIIDGVLFRFIDTAGLRDTNDHVEAIGVSRSKEKMKEAALILYLIDQNTEELGLVEELEELKKVQKKYLLIANKSDIKKYNKNKILDHEFIPISAAEGTNLDELKKEMISQVGYHSTGRQNIVNNPRHLDCLNKTKVALEKTLKGLEHGLSSDLVALDLKYALNYLGEITGEITSDDLLGNIFSRFCIGK